MRAFGSIVLKLLVLRFVATAVALPGPNYGFDQKDYSADSVITRDVCVIGGGSTGTYSAIRLKDLGKSVVVVEAKGRLGGHTETWTDPATGGKIDIGVVVWHSLDLVRNYFARFNIPLVNIDLFGGGGDGVAKYVDFRTGEEVDGYTPNDISGGLTAYTEQLVKYPYLDAGISLPDPVPEDLLLSLEDFLEKYPAIKPAAYFLITVSQGYGDLLHSPTLYTFKVFGLDLVKDIQEGLLATERQNNSELYEKAQEELGDNVLLNSRVLKTDRTRGAKYAKIIVKTPSGTKLIRAKKIVLTIPPQLKNLQGFDLSEKESRLFEKFKENGYWTGVLRGSGIPEGTTVQNVGVDTPYNLPSLPGAYAIYPSSIQGLLNVKYGSDYSLPDSEIKADIIAAVERLRTAGTLNTTKPEFAEFSSHTPFALEVSADEIKKGFYNKLYELQGQRHTYYTGGAFHTHDSSLLWNYTEVLIPRIAEQL